MDDALDQLPVTVDWALRERELIEHWLATQAGAAQGSSAGPKFSVSMPPPNVTGQLHMGHALNMTIQDLVTRLKRKQGFDVLWLPGTDHASIATHFVVERDLAKEGKTRFSIGREAFLKLAEEWKNYASGAIQDQIRRLGCIPDWSRERFTMDEGLTRAVLKVFVQLYKEGLIYRDKRLVNWDPKLLTAISDLEVQSLEVQGYLWHLRYPVEGSDRYIIVATTRPETMLGDTAVAVHPDDERYRNLIGKHVILPLVGRRIPIVVDDYADPEAGSGAVKITPAHDFNDFEVGRRHNLPLVNIMDVEANIRLRGNAEFLQGVPPSLELSQTIEALDGLDRFTARASVVSLLEERELIEKTVEHPHTVPHGDRSGVPIEPFLTDQWYVDAKTLAGPAIESVRAGSPAFVPQNWEKVYFDWLENIQPWCISRQLWFGHRIPAWYGPDGEVFVEESAEESREAAGRHYGHAVDLTQDEDVLDTWFSSGLWPFATLGWPKRTDDFARYYPTDLLVTGFDIIFFWVARMVMQGLKFTGEEPFRTVFVHGLVRDGQGQKMSKTKGNVLDPLELIDEFGADATRLALMTLCGLGQDIRFSSDVVRAAKLFITKFWNAARFASMNAARPGPAFDPLSVKHEMNRWIVQEFVAAGRTTIENFESFRFNEGCTGLQAFVRDRFCDWYLEFAKVMLVESEALADETRQTMGWCIAAILQLLNPVTPFVTETMWAYFGDGSSIVTAPLSDLPVLDGQMTSEPAVARTISLISRIRSVRSELSVPAGARVPLVMLPGDPTLLEGVQRHAPQIERLAMVAQITPVETMPSGAVPIHVNGIDAALLLDGFIDFKRERERLGKSISKALDTLARLEGQLSDEAYIRNAPDKAVEKSRLRHKGTVEEIERLEKALARLSAWN